MCSSSGPVKVVRQVAGERAQALHRSRWTCSRAWHRLHDDELPRRIAALQSREVIGNEIAVALDCDDGLRGLEQRPRAAAPVSVPTSSTPTSAPSVASACSGIRSARVAVEQEIGRKWRLRSGCVLAQHLGVLVGIRAQRSSNLRDGLATARARAFTRRPSLLSDCFPPRTSAARARSPTVSPTTRGTPLSPVGMPDSMGTLIERSSKRRLVALAGFSRASAAWRVGWGDPAEDTRPAGALGKLSEGDPFRGRAGPIRFEPGRRTDAEGAEVAAQHLALGGTE